MSNIVLIVESNKEVRALIKVFVQSFGFKVIEAENGYEAIEKIIQYHPYIVMIDLILPQIDAATTAKIIRKLEGFDNVSIIALTEFSNTCFDKAIEVGFDDVLVNPLSPENLKHCLQRFVD